MSAPAGLVCVVDDDASVRKSLVRLFRSAGFVVERSNPRARISLAARFMTGRRALFSTCKCPSSPVSTPTRARRERSRRTSHLHHRQGRHPDVRAEAMKAGAADFLPKPSSDSELLDAVERALVRSSAQQLRKS